MKYVKQEQKLGCVIACIAMILEEDYWTIRNNFPKKRFKDEIGVDTGLSIEWDASSYLFEKGYICYTKWRNVFYSQEDRTEEDFLTEFAPIHILSVELHGHAHACILKDGIIYDPYREGEYTFKDYEKINMMIGFWKIENFSLET